MKIKKYLLALLLGSVALFDTTAVAGRCSDAAEEAVDAGDELAADYLALLEAQG